MRLETPRVPYRETIRKTAIGEGRHKKPVSYTHLLPKERVIGSGTLLDSARLRYLMGEYLNVSSNNCLLYTSTGITYGNR